MAIRYEGKVMEKAVWKDASVWKNQAPVFFQNNSYNFLLNFYTCWLLSICNFRCLSKIVNLSIRHIRRPFVTPTCCYLHTKATHKSLFDNWRRHIYTSSMDHGWYLTRSSTRLDDDICAHRSHVLSPFQEVL